MDNRSMSRGEVAVKAEALTDGVDQVGLASHEQVSGSAVKERPAGAVTPDLTALQAHHLGGTAIFSTPEMTKTTETEATKELARDLSEVEHAERYVGDETKLQVEDRLQEDKADAEAEMGMGDPWTAKVTVRSQEELSRVVASAVGKYLKQPSFNVNKLERFYHEEASRAWGIFGRELGERN